MILKVQVMAMTEDGSQEICEIASVERTDLKPETLGLTLAEGKAILKGIQQTVIQRQISSKYLKSFDLTFDRNGVFFTRIFPRDNHVSPPKFEGVRN